MDKYSLAQIVAIIFGGSGIATFLISLFVYASGRLDKSRARRIEEFNEKLKESADLKRLTIEADRATSQTVIDQLWRMLEEEKKQVSALKSEVEKMGNKNVLSTALITSLHRSIARIRLQLAEIERKLQHKITTTDVDDILGEIGALRNCLDELELELPK